jgi:hypothetical protein
MRGRQDRNGQRPIHESGPTGALRRSNLMQTHSGHEVAFGANGGNHAGPQGRHVDAVVEAGTKMIRSVMD